MANVDEVIGAALNSEDIYDTDDTDDTAAAAATNSIAGITNWLEAEVFIGSEFTFGIGGENINLPMEVLETSGVPGGIKALIEKHVTEFCKNTNKNKGLDYYCELAQGKVKWVNFKPYILTIVSKSLRKPIYWIRYDVDPNCMELQMQPMTYNEYSQNRVLLQDIVFKEASNKGFTPITDITGGGGHISFSRNMFDDNVETLIKFIILYSLEVSEGKLDDFDSLRECKDDENAPILTRQQMQVFKELLNPAKPENSAIVTSMDNFVQFMNEKVYIQLNEGVIAQYISIDQKKGGHAKSKDIIREFGRHYQAINLEHMTERDGSLRRIEMRRFDAQKDIYEFLRQVESLYKLYAAAKIIPIADVLALI